MQTNVKDVVVIGGGVVGTAILRNLSLYQLDVVLVEKQPELCEGASKANSGIIHTGFDAPPNTLEADCLRRSRDLWPQMIEDLKIPYIPCGAVMIATSEEERTIIEQKYIPNARANGVEVSWISRDDVLEMNPAITDEVIGGLLIPGEAICDPFKVTRSYAELAVLNGAKVLLGSGVEKIEDHARGFKLILEDNQEIVTRYVVNAAGVYSDKVARLIGDESFSITPRKGQFVLTEEQVNISQVILPIPTAKSKGTLVTPVVFGGFLFGPTAEDQEDKDDRSTTEAGIEQILAGCDKLIPGTRHYQSIRQFAGVRAVCSEGDYVIRPSCVNHRMIHAAGIRSTGLSASPGIAEVVVEKLEEVGLSFVEKEEARVDIPDLFSEAEDEDTGEIVCLCRSISKGEIKNALKRPVPPATLDGIKRSTGAMMGECQGNCCIPKILDLLDEHWTNLEQPLKGLQHSYLVAGKGGK